MNFLIMLEVRSTVCTMTGCPISVNGTFLIFIVNSINTRAKKNYEKELFYIFFLLSDVEIAKLEKRRKRLRERSPSPIPHSAVEAGRPPSPLLPLPSVAPHLNRLPETHAKIMYMSAIGLARNTEEQKAVQEVIWSAILDDRLARGDPLSTLNTYFVRLRDMAAVEAPARPPCPLGSLLAPSSEASTTAAASSATAVLSPPQLFPSLNIPSVHCVKEEAGGPHLVKLEAGVEAGGGGGEHKALCNSFLAIKAEPTEDVVTNNGDLKRRLEAPLLNDSQLVSPPKRRPQHHQQLQHHQQQQHQKQLQQQQGGDEGRVFAWPGIQAIEMAYKTYKEGGFPLNAYCTYYLRQIFWGAQNLPLQLTSSASDNFTAFSPCQILSLTVKLYFTVVFSHYWLLLG